MAIDKGNIKTSANYDVRAQKPMEARREKPRKVDLITKESWSYDGNTVYAHKGLQVWVEEEGKTYVLKDLSKMFEPDYSGWEMQLTDANVAKVATSGQYSDLSGKPTFATVNGKRIDQGGNIVIESSAKVEVDTELSDTSENAIANSTVSRALAEKQERLMDGVNIKTINGQNVLGRGNIEIEGGGGGITEETEVYIGEEEPTDDGAKLWIDPTGTPSGGNGGGNASGGESASGLNIFYIPEGVYTATKDSPYLFSPEECSAFLDTLEVDNVIYATKHFYSYAVGPFRGMLLTRDMRPSEVGPFDLLFSGQSVYDMSDTGLMMLVHTYTISFIDGDTVQGYYKFYSYATGIN